MVKSKKASTGITGGFKVAKSPSDNNIDICKFLDTINGTIRMFCFPRK